MKAGRTKPSDEMRMSSKDFDRIMSQALRVRPEEAQKPKPATKTKAARKKTKPHQK
jgi:hypothetical protein